MQITPQLTSPGTVVAVSPADNSAVTAALNAAAIQAALNNGGKVYVTCPPGQQAWVNATLTIPSNTSLEIDPGLELSWTTAFNNIPMTNASYGAAFTTATGTFTAVGTLGTLVSTGHGFSAGQYILILGATVSGYNGCYRIQSVPDANTITVRLPFVPAATTATGTIIFRAADNNIAVKGRFFFNGTARTYNNNFLGCGLILFGVYGFNVSGFQGRDTVRYSILAGGVYGGFSQSGTVNNTYGGGDDGFHVQGPAFALTIRDFRGRCNDDMVSLTTGDYSYIQLCQGDLYDITVSNVHCEWSANPGSGVKIIGRAAYIADEIVVDGIRGTVNSAGFTMGDDAGYATGTTCGRVQVKNVSISPQSTGPSVLIGGNVGGVYQMVEIEDVNYNTDTAGQAVNIGTGAIFDKLQIKGVRGYNMPVNSTPIVLYSFTANDVVIQDCTFSAQGYAACISIPAGGNYPTIQTLRIDGVDVLGNSGSKCEYVLQNGGTINRLQIFNGTAVNCLTTFHQASSSAICPEAIYGNLSCVSSVIAIHQSSCNLSFGNVRCTGVNGPMNLQTTGQTYSVVGEINSAAATNDIGLTGTPGLRVNGNFRLDASQLTASLAGDQFWNTNTTWTGGSGTSKAGWYGCTVAPTTYVKVFGPP